ncbi:MAG: DUF1572 family protein [Acidobacteriota bacterium]|nr:DUF1572 family protein [Acidobacteriota bacterium]
MATTPFTTSYLQDALYMLHKHKERAEAAMAQLSEEQFFVQLDPESNSIALIVKHLAGNMRSRFTDFFTTDGEKPNRNRDSEFVSPPATRAEVMALWESGWQLVFRTLEPLTEQDLARTVVIYGQPHSAMQAIHQQLCHYCLHVGQIIFLAKHLASNHWQSISIPRKH